MGCFWQGSGGGVELVPASKGDGKREVSVEKQVVLTKETVELRRVRREHVGLIESIPTPGATQAVKTKLEVQMETMARIVHNPEGLPYVVPVDEKWFDPEVGLLFFRARGGGLDE